MAEDSTFPQPRRKADAVRQSRVSKESSSKRESTQTSGTADRKTLIVVDFGTTLSGVAWAQSPRVEILFLITVTLSILTSWVA